MILSLQQFYKFTYEATISLYLENISTFHVYSQWALSLDYAG